MKILVEWCKCLLEIQISIFGGVPLSQSVNIDCGWIDGLAGLESGRGLRLVVAKKVRGYL